MVKDTNISQPDPGITSCLYLVYRPVTFIITAVLVNVGYITVPYQDVLIAPTAAHRL